MNYARYYHTASLLPNGNVLITGGNSSIGITTNTELYNPSTRLWTVTTSMNYPRYAHAATVLNNETVFVTSGQSGTAYLTNPELYEP